MFDFITRKKKIKFLEGKYFIPICDKYCCNLYHQEYRLAYYYLSKIGTGRIVEAQTINNQTETDACCPITTIDELYDAVQQCDLIERDLSDCRRILGAYPKFVMSIAGLLDDNVSDEVRIYFNPIHYYAFDLDIHNNLRCRFNFSHIICALNSTVYTIISQETFNNFLVNHAPDGNISRLLE